MWYVLCHVLCVMRYVLCYARYIMCYVLWAMCLCVVCCTCDMCYVLCFMFLRNHIGCEGCQFQINCSLGGILNFAIWVGYLNQLIKKNHHIDLELIWTLSGPFQTQSNRFSVFSKHNSLNVNVFQTFFHNWTAFLPGATMSNMYGSLSMMNIYKIKLMIRYI